MPNPAPRSVGSRNFVSVRLRPPSDPSAPVRRDDLLRRISERRAPVTLVCGPAGSGKSSLLALYAGSLADAGPVVAWVSIDRHADDAGALWTDILAALLATRRFPDHFRLHDLAAPRTERLAPFIDEVVAAVVTLGAPVWLVLDDVHHVRDPAALRSLSMLIDRLPEDVHLVMASRRDPPLGLPRLRLEGRLFELRAAELAFTLPEAAHLLRQADPELAGTAIRALHERTEGWAAGLRLAAMAVAGDHDTAEVMRRFGGDDAAVADYLVTEVFTGLPPDVLAFLRSTSICETIHVDLARRLSGRADAAMVLDDLERSNLFTQLLSRDRRVYRYHELMRTHLTAELLALDPEAVEALHGLAADWYAERGDVVAAIHHLGRTGVVERLVTYLAQHGIGAILDGQARAVSTVLGQIATRHRRIPLLALIGALAELELDDIHSADRWLAGRDVASIEDDESLTALEATIVLARARYASSLDTELARLESLGAGDTGDADRDLLALHHRGVARLSMGRYEDAASDLRRAVHLARSTGRAAIEFASVSYLAGTAAATGAMIEMRSMAEQAVALAEQRGWSASQPMVNALALIAWSAYLRADRHDAVASSRRARELLGAHVEPDLELAVRGLAVLIAADGAPAHEALHEYRRHFERLVDSQVSPALLACILPDLVRFSLDTGERDLAEHFAGVARARLPKTGEDVLIRSMMLMASGKQDAARLRLGSAVQGNVRCLVVPTRVRIQITAAVLENRRGNQVRSREHLRAAQRLAAPIELVRPFLDSREARELLIREGASSTQSVWLVEQVLADAAPDTPATGGLEALTSTELAVLRELASLLSLPELADRRGVSVNTIKTHVRSIYRKLGVDGRRKAVDAARRQGLL